MLAERVFEYLIVSVGVFRFVVEQKPRRIVSRNHSCTAESHI